MKNDYDSINYKRKPKQSKLVTIIEFLIEFVYMFIYIYIEYSNNMHDVYKNSERVMRKWHKSVMYQ